MVYNFNHADISFKTSIWRGVEISNSTFGTLGHPNVFGSLIIRLIFQPISSVVSLKKLCKTVNQCLIIAVINNLKIFVTLNCIHSFYAEKFSAKDKLLIFQCQVSIFLEHWKISIRSSNLFLSSFYLLWNIHLKLSCQL